MITSLNKNLYTDVKVPVVEGPHNVASQQRFIYRIERDERKSCFLL